MLDKYLCIKNVDFFSFLPLTYNLHFFRYIFFHEKEVVFMAHFIFYIFLSLPHQKRKKKQQENYDSTEGDKIPDEMEA